MQYVLRLTPAAGTVWPADKLQNIEWDVSFDGLAALAEDDGDDDAITALLVHGFGDLAKVRRAAESYGDADGNAQAFQLVPVRLDASPALEVIFYDRHGNECDRFTGPADEAAQRAASFMILQGTDPDEDGADAGPGSVRFAPADVKTEAATTPTLDNLTPFQRGYVNALFNLEGAELVRQGLANGARQAGSEDRPGYADLTDAARRYLLADCDRFTEHGTWSLYMEALREDITGRLPDAMTAGAAFWIARNGLGEGFSAFPSDYRDKFNRIARETFGVVGLVEMRPDGRVNVQEYGDGVEPEEG